MAGVFTLLIFILRACMKKHAQVDDKAKIAPWVLAGGYCIFCDC